MRSRAKTYFIESAVLGFLYLVVSWLWGKLTKAVGWLGTDAVGGWINRQIGEWFGLAAPTLDEAVSLIWDWGIPLALLGLGARAYHVVARHRYGEASPPRSDTEKSAPASSRLLEVALSNDELKFERYESVCVISVRNKTENTMEKSCLVEIVETDFRLPVGVPSRIVMRTAGQIDGNRTGRFTLSKNQAKPIPLIFKSGHRPHEWFIISEHKKTYLIPSRSMKLLVSVYGGDLHSRVLITLTVGQGIHANLQEVLEDYSITTREVSSQAEREPTSNKAELFPDWTIRELFFYIDPNVLDLKSADYLARDGWEVIGDDLLDKLSTGQLQAWGRLWTQTAGHPALTPIPATFWGDADFTYDFFAADHQHYKHAGPRRSRDGRGTWYADIRLNRAQVLSILPGKSPSGSNILSVDDLIARAKAVEENAIRKLAYAEKVMSGERDEETWLRKLDIQRSGFDQANLEASPLLSRSQKTCLYELHIRNAELDSTIASIISKKSSDPHPHPAGMYANRMRGLLGALKTLIEDLEGKPRR